MKQLRLEWPLDTWDLPDGEHLLEVPSLAAGRQLLGPTADADRAARGRRFWQNPQMQHRMHLRLGMHDRGEAHLIADAALDPRDAAGHRRHLPLHVKLIRRRMLRLAAGEALDVTASHRSWPGLHPREELYVLLQINQLVAGAGASISVRGNVFIVNCGQLVLEGMPSRPSPAVAPFEIRIRGTEHSAFGATRRLPAHDGRRGTDGQPGQPGAPAQLCPSAFGPIEIAAATAGADGMAGGRGGNGTAGQAGGMAMLADLRFAAIAAGLPDRSIRVTAQAEAGRPGGAGGHGGNGGPGGASQVAPGHGGDGGHGGRGGNGGHGGLASNVFIAAAAQHRRLFDLCPLASAGGAPGAGGGGGAGGPGGDGTFQDGCSGTPGSPGQAGLPGRGRPAASMFFIPTGEADAVNPPNTPDGGPNHG